jgi:hypothetical protein
MNASFEELRRLAAQHGVTLLHAYIAAGIADSSYYRHRDGRNGMTIGTYNTIRKAILNLARVAA